MRSFEGKKNYVFGGLVEVLARKKSLELQITKPQTRNPQITKNWARKSQIRKVPHLRKVDKSINLTKQICRFVICGIYLQTSTFGLNTARA
jgi:hypothetical protein